MGPAGAGAPDEVRVEVLRPYLCFLVALALDFFAFFEAMENLQRHGLSLYILNVLFLASSSDNFRPVELTPVQGQVAPVQGPEARP